MRYSALFFLCCLWGYLNAASTFEVRLQEGVQRDLCVHTLQRDTLIISPQCGERKLYAIPTEKIESVCNSEYCIDLATEDFNPSILLSPLQKALLDTLRFPEVSIWLQNEQNQVVRFLSFANDTLKVAGHLANGEAQVVKLHKSRLKGVEFPEGKWLNLNSSDIDYPKNAHQLIDPLAKLTLQSQPTGATIFLDDIEMGITPIQLNKVGAGLRHLKIETQILGQNYSVSKEISLYPGDAQSYYLNLKKEHPKLWIKTEPAGAEVYLTPFPDLSKPSPLKTPFEDQKITSGPHSLTLFHPNYRDTTLLIKVSPFSPTIVDLKLPPLSQGLNAQRHMLLLKERRRSQFFEIFQYFSLPLIASGTLFHLNAFLSREDALRSRNTLRHPHVDGGSQFRKLRQENSEQFERAQLLEYTGWGLLGAGLLFQGVAWSFYF